MEGQAENTVRPDQSHLNVNRHFRSQRLIAREGRDQGGTRDGRVTGGRGGDQPPRRGDRRKLPAFLCRHQPEALDASGGSTRSLSLPADAGSGGCGVGGCPPRTLWGSLQW